MPDEDNNFGGSLVSDFRKWWRHVQPKNWSPPNMYWRGSLPLPNGLLNILLLKETKFSCFLWSFLLFGDFFEVALQATPAMFVTNYPQGYTEVDFCYSQTEKLPVNRLKIRACLKSRRFCCDKLPRNRHKIAASLHGRFGIATKIAAKIAYVNGPLNSLFPDPTCREVIKTLLEKPTC